MAVVNSSALVLWKEYKYLGGMNVKDQREFEERILSRARRAGLDCTITQEEISLDSFTALIGLGAATCMRISKHATQEKKRGILRKIASQAFTSYNGDIFITFSSEGKSVLMKVYESASNGALLDLIEGTAKGEPVRELWTEKMEAIIQEVAETCF